MDGRSHGDVFALGTMTDDLRRAGVVLCNPPFEKFTTTEREKYGASLYRSQRTVDRVLDDLHPASVLGLWLPMVAVDGRGYAALRERLAGRYARMEFTALPDKVFEEADAETALLIDTEPIRSRTALVIPSCAG